MRRAGLIVAAGMSRRMNSFKPLMTLNGFPMIYMTVQSLRNGGIDDVLVVVGNRGEDIKKVLAPLGVRFAENLNYETTDMLASVRIGLRELLDYDAVYLLPGDIPLVSPRTMQEIGDVLTRACIENELHILEPNVKGKASHPLIILKNGFELILHEKTTNGLKGLKEILNLKKIELNEHTRQFDADTKEEFDNISKLAKKAKGVSFSICKKMYAEKGLPEHIVRHCIAVGDLAANISKRLISAGACIDIELCRSGGYLHDLCKLEADHERKVGEYLRKKGYVRLAEVAEAHKGFFKMPETLCSEEAIVCLADKLVREDKRVSIDERYSRALSMQQIKPWILNNIEICHALSNEFFEITGLNIEKEI